MKRILVISFSNLNTDPRVNRQIRLLATHYDVTAAGTADPNVDGVKYIPISTTRKPLLSKALAAAVLKLGRYEQYYWMDGRAQACRAALAQVQFDVIVANDIATLPLAFSIANGAKVILDAHEYAPRELEDSPFWRFFFQRYNDYLCRTYLGRIDAMFTVCRSIAEEYRKVYGVSASVLINAPPYLEIAPSTTVPDAIRMVHHGGAAPSRRLELMIEMMDLLDKRFRLDMFLMPSVPAYLKRLSLLAAKGSRVRILPPIPMPQLTRRLNEYDLGVYILPPNSFNNEYALPNKFFEFVQARLGVAIGPSPEMASLIHRYKCGVVAEDFTPNALASKLIQLDRATLDYFKRRSHEAARALSFEENGQVLLRNVEKVLQ
jgi:Glycosyltransferase Family 4